jgi:DNA-binding transcriptional LysR family regulator
MDLGNLQTFVATAQLRSFSRAAEQLHLTQPAISKRIAVLEGQLRVRLFDRIGRQVTLTEAGMEFLPRARRVIVEMEDSLRALSNLSGTVAGKLRMGTSHHVGLHRLPPVLRTYTQRYPKVELDIRFMDSEQACRAVESGEMEVAIVTLPSAPPPVLLTRRTWLDRLAFVAAGDHALAADGEVSLEALSTHPAVLPAVGTYTREILERAFAPRGLQLSIGMSTNYLETLKMLVSVGLGWSVLPGTLVDDSLKVLHCPDVSLERELGVVLHSERTLSNAARVMVEACELHADSH